MPRRLDIAGRPLRAAAFALAVGALATAFATLLVYAPFYAPSYAFWAGVFACVLASAVAAWPSRRVRARLRLRAACVAGAGLATSLGALLWPFSLLTPAPANSKLDSFLPTFQAREYHERRTRAPIDRVERALREVRLADMPVAMVLLRLRALAGGGIDQQPMVARPILEVTTDPATGFLGLDTTTPRELVFGLAGRPWADDPSCSASTPEQFRTYATPDAVRVAFDLRIIDEGRGVVCLSTETRCLGTDDAGQHRFERYWRVIYPGSSILRRLWLDAVVARAEQP